MTTGASPSSAARRGRAERRRDAVRDHPEPRTARPPRSPAARSSDTQLTASAPRSSTLAARYSAWRTPWNVASTGGRRGPRASRAPERRQRGDARVVRVHDARGARAGSRPPGRATPRRPRRPAERPRSGTTSRSIGAPASSGSSAPAGPHNDDLVAAPRQLARERDHDALGAADVGARRGEQDPHRASEALVERERPVDHRGGAAAGLDVRAGPPPPGRARAPGRRAAARSPPPAPPGRPARPAARSPRARAPARRRRASRRPARRPPSPRAARAARSPCRTRARSTASRDERVARRHVPGERHPPVEPERPRALLAARRRRPRRTARSAPAVRAERAASRKTSRPLTGSKLVSVPTSSPPRRRRDVQLARRWGSP